MLFHIIGFDYFIIIIKDIADMCFNRFAYLVLDAEELIISKHIISVVRRLFKAYIQVFAICRFFPYRSIAFGKPLPAKDN